MTPWAIWLYFFTLALVDAWFVLRQISNKLLLAKYNVETGLLYSGHTFHCVMAGQTHVCAELLQFLAIINPCVTCCLFC